MIVNKMLSVTHFGPNIVDFGISDLYKKDVFETAFPLHDGNWEWTNQGPLNDRQVKIRF